MRNQIVGRVNFLEVIRIVGAGGRSLVMTDPIGKVLGLLNNAPEVEHLRNRRIAEIVVGLNDPVEISNTLMICAVACPETFHRFVVELHVACKGKLNSNLVVGLTFGCFRTATWLMSLEVEKLSKGRKDCYMTTFLEDWVFFQEEGVEDKKPQPAILGELANLVGPFVTQAAIHFARRAVLTRLLSVVAERRGEGQKASLFGEAIIREIQYKIFGHIPLARRDALLVLYLNDGGPL